MTSGLFWISYAAAWVLLLVLSGGLLILFRFSVRANRMQTSSGVGDVGTMNGPALDDRPPVMELQDLAGDPVSVGGPTGTAQLIMFAKNTCPKCKLAIELLHSFASEHAPLEPIVVYGGGRAAIEECASAVGSPLTAVADVEWKGAKTWHVSRFPFGVVLDSAGVVRGRGDPTSATMLTILTQHMEMRRDVALAPMDHIHTS